MTDINNATTTTSNENRLITIEPKSLVFPRTSNRVETRVIKLRNESATSQLAFKIKTTAPLHYSVRPPAGLIYPLSTVDVQIALSPNAGPEIFKHDKFLINAVVLTKPTAQEMWAEAEKRPDLLIKERLMVTFESATGPSVASSGGGATSATPAATMIQQQVSRAPVIGNVGMSGLFDSSLMKSALAEPPSPVVHPPLQSQTSSTAAPIVTMMGGNVMPNGILATVLDEDYVATKPSHQQLQYPVTPTPTSLSSVNTPQQPTTEPPAIAPAPVTTTTTAEVVAETAPMVPAVQPEPELVEQPKEPEPTPSAPSPPPQPQVPQAAAAAVAVVTPVVEKGKEGEKEIEELKRVVEELTVKLKAVTAERDRHMARNQVLGRELEAEKKKKSSPTSSSTSSSSATGGAGGPVVVYNWQWIAALMILISILIYRLSISPFL